MSAPFAVLQSRSGNGQWALWMRTPLRHCGYFDSPGEAIDHADHAYRNWPWWP